MWKMMIYAPKDREIVVVAHDGQVGVARWVDQDASWKCEEVHSWVIGDSPVKAVLWTDKPTGYEMSIGRTA